MATYLHVWMEESYTAFIMQGLLLVTLVAASQSHWGSLGSSSAQEDWSQRCCEELDLLQKAFAAKDESCLEEDCISWLADVRSSFLGLNVTSCPVPEDILCEKVTNMIFNHSRTVPDTVWTVSDQVTVKNILRVVDTQKWQNCVVIYDSSVASALHLLTTSLSDRLTDFVIYDVLILNQTSTLRSVLKEVFGQLLVRNIIVMAYPAFVYKLFGEAEDYDKNLGRTSGLRMFTRWIVATSGGLEKQLAQAASYFDNVVAIAENQEFIATNSKSFSNNLQCMTTEIYSLMYVHNGSREFQSVTILLPGGDLIVNDTFPNIRHGFNTRKLIVGTKLWSPFVIKTVDSSGTPNYTGLCMDMLRELASILNFTYVIVEPPSNEGWGERNATGHWEGLVGLLHRQEIDLAVASLSFSPDRALIMDATYPYMAGYLGAVYKKPDPALEKWKILLRPFKGEVLLCLGITLLLVTCLLHVIAWLSPVPETGMDKEAERKKKHPQFPGPSPDDGFWYLYGALLSQGGEILPKASSSRMLVTAWWLFSIVMGASYSGNLVAWLTVQLESKPFESMQEMLEQDTYIWGSMNKTVSHMMLTNTKNPVLKDVGIKLEQFAASNPDILSMDPDVQLKLIKAGGYVYIVDSVSTEYWIRDDCDLAGFNDYNSMAIPYTINLPRGSAYTGLFNDYVMRIIEAGFLRKLKREWFADKLLCVKSIVTESPKISVPDVQSVLYAGFIGVGLALISLAFEFLCQRYPKLRSWTSKIGDACVNGCQEEEAEQKSNGDDRGQKDRFGHQNNNNEVDGEDGRTAESGFCELVVNAGRGDDEVGLPVAIFDFGSANRQNQFFKFDTVYSSHEDFGRDSAFHVVHQSGWHRRGSRIVQISDDQKTSV